MFERLYNLYDRLTYSMPNILAGICVFFCVVLGLGLGFGTVMLIAWILMLVYNAIAAAFNWPVFSIWVWFGIVCIINWLRGGFSSKVSKKED